MKVMIATINSKYAHTSLGVYAVAGYLRATTEHEVSVKEYALQTPLLSVLADIQPVQPQVLCLAVYIWNKNEILQLADMVKKVLPDCKIVLGGPEVSFHAECILQKYAFVDYIVQGEGEEATRNLLLALNTSAPMVSVSYREHISSEIAVVEDLDTLPFIYEYLPELDLSNRIVYYESSRGCPYSCSYCLSGISHLVRHRSVDKVLRELQWFINRKVRQVKFVDRTYNLDIKHYLPIMEFLAAADTDTNFHFEIKADILSEQVVDFLSKVPLGRFQLEIGIQSTHAPTLQAINRQNNFEKLANNVVRLLENKNMHIHVDLIAGLPHESYEDFKTSFNQVYALGADMLQLGFLKILHGSQISSELIQHNYQYMMEPPYEVLQNKYISYEQLRRLKLVEDLLEKYHNSGLYKHSLPRIIACFADAFDFFEQLSYFVEQNGMQLQNLSTKTTLKLLLDFVRSSLTTRSEELVECLHLDVFVAGEGWRKEFFVSPLDDAQEDFLNFFRNEDIVRKYLPNYQTQTWRQIKKNYPMEIFKINSRTIYIFDVTDSKLVEVDERDFYGTL